MLFVIRLVTVKLSQENKDRKARNCSLVHVQLAIYVRKQPVRDEALRM